MGRVLPILFNTDMVRAILDGRKTVTRRLIKDPPHPDMPGDHNYCRMQFFVKDYLRTLHYMDVIEQYPFRQTRYFESLAPYDKDDIMYVRETWSTHYTGDSKGELVYCYRADGVNLKSECLPGEWNRWYPSIHMPKEAARIWLKVTDVRVERLDTMMLDDFLKEGVVVRPEAFNDPENAYQQAKSMFINIWDSTVKEADKPRYGYDASPWVWVIEFERCGKPEPCILKGIEPAQDERPCIGYGRAEDDDEPCGMCKGCKSCSNNGEAYDDRT